MKIKTLVLICLLCCPAKMAMAAAVPEVEAIHNELRTLRDGLMDAINKNDIERQLTYLHTNVVITWHNAEVSRGRESVLAYYKRLTTGPEKMVESYKADITVDELTILHGEDTGIAFGSSTEDFLLTNGSRFLLKGRWSATLVKENGQWLIANLHASTNFLDNAILSIVKSRAFRFFCLAALLGIIIGGLFGWLIGRKRRPAT